MCVRGRFADGTPCYRCSPDKQRYRHRLQCELSYRMIVLAELGPSVDWVWKSYLQRIMSDAKCVRPFRDIVINGARQVCERFYRDQQDNPAWKAETVGGGVANEVFDYFEQHARERASIDLARFSALAFRHKHELPKFLNVPNDNRFNSYLNDCLSHIFMRHRNISGTQCVIECDYTRAAIGLLKATLHGEVEQNHHTPYSYLWVIGDAAVVVFVRRVLEDYVDHVSLPMRTLLGLTGTAADNKRVLRSATAAAKRPRHVD